MPGFFQSGEKYCALCDKYFGSIQARDDHIQLSSNHPRCDECRSRFLNKNVLRNHFIYSIAHHFCASCEIHFETASGFRMHIEHAAVHRDDSDDEEEDEELENEMLEPGWEDRLGEIRYPDEYKEANNQGDRSWESFDDYDFEQEEELGDIPSDDMSFFQSEDTDRTEEENVVFVSRFTCPSCKSPSDDVCCTPCGHMFCIPCIYKAYQRTSECPLCHELGSTKQLRRLYLSI